MMAAFARKYCILKPTNKIRRKASAYSGATAPALLKTLIGVFQKAAQRDLV
jgi:hypothetical protein